MKKLFLAFLLAGCASAPETRSENLGARMACHVMVCSPFARQHNYSLLGARVAKGKCVCRMMSDHSPDEFDVKLPLPK